MHPDLVAMISPKASLTGDPFAPQASLKEESLVSTKASLKGEDDSHSNVVPFLPLFSSTSDGSADACEVTEQIAGSSEGSTASRGMQQLSTPRGNSKPGVGSPSTGSKSGRTGHSAGVVVEADDDTRSIKMKLAKQLKSLNKAVDALVDVQSEVSQCVRSMTSDSQRFDNILEKIGKLWEEKTKVMQGEDTRMQSMLEELKGCVESAQEGVELLFEEARHDRAHDEIDLAAQAIDIVNEASSELERSHSTELAMKTASPDNFRLASSSAVDSTSARWDDFSQSKSESQYGRRKSESYAKVEKRNIEKRRSLHEGVRHVHEDLSKADDVTDRVPPDLQRKKTAGTLLVPGMASVAATSSSGRSSDEKDSRSRDRSKSASSRRASTSCDPSSPGSQHSRRSSHAERRHCVDSISSHVVT